jgi:hypothetical protein
MSAMENLPKGRILVIAGVLACTRKRTLARAGEVLAVLQPDLEDPEQALGLIQVAWVRHSRLARRSKKSHQTRTVDAIQWSLV